jgi:hypothetical protein
MHQPPPSFQRPPAIQTSRMAIDTIHEVETPESQSKSKYAPVDVKVSIDHQAVFINYYIFIDILKILNFLYLICECNIIRCMCLYFCRVQVFSRDLLINLLTAV